MTKKNDFLDQEERQLIEAYRRGDFVHTKAAKALKEKLVQSAKYHLKKNARINIRLPEADVEHLKIMAAQEGMPYQTLVASVLHKFVSGRLRAE